MVVVGVVAIGLFVVVNRHRLKNMWRYAVKALAFGAAIGGALLLIPGAFTVFGPQNTHGPPTSAIYDNVFPVDLLGSIVPSSQWLSTQGLTTMVNSRFPYSYAEYIGIPMIVVLGCFAIFFRKQRTMLFAGAMALITFVLSLGPRLWIDGHETSVPLPWAVFTHLPVLGGFAPVRFSLFTSFFVAVMFSVGLDEVRRRLRAADGPRFLSPSRRALAASSASVALAAIVVLPLVPASAQPATQTNIPSFFTSAAVDAIPEGSVVLSYPYPDESGPNLFAQPPRNILLYQAASGMRFKLIGGYGWFPSSSGDGGTNGPTVLNPRSVQEIFDGAYWNTPAVGSLLARADATANLRALLKKYDVDAVILQPQGREPGAVARYVRGAIGCPAYFQDVAVWLHVKQRLADRLAEKDVNTCGRPPDIAPHTVVFAHSSTVSGTTTLMATTNSYLSTSSVAYYVSGGSLHDKLIGSGIASEGWVVRWNTTTLPNGRYVLRSVAVDSAGGRSTSSGTAITVRN
jgi:hypothetical protein